jgi:hypothetical protein
MTEWLLPVALGVHFRFLLHSFLRVKKPEVIPRCHPQTNRKFLAGYFFDPVN